MKEKLAKASSREKLQILTLVLESWSLRKAGKEFGVSKTTVFKARKLRDQKGIIALPEKCRRQKISNEIIQLVQEFYCSDEFSIQLPGKKDYFNVGRNQHMSKRLILCNLKELYAAFRLKYPDIKLGLSKFASLRPKWYILAGPKGMHCVCMHHTSECQVNASCSWFRV